MQIVKFLPDQYDALAQILSAAYAEYIFDAEALRNLDANLEGRYVARRWMGMQAGILVAVGEYRHTPEMFHPREFLLTIAVHPDYQRQGIGRQLYHHLREDLVAYDPLKLRASCRADHARSVAFLEQRGFARGMHVLELQLDLEGVIPEGVIPQGAETNCSYEIGAAAYAPAPEVEIASMTTLATDRDRDHKLYNLITALRAEVPLPQAATPVSYEQFVSGFLAAPSRLPDATLIAVRNGKYVGFTDMFEDGDGGLYCGLTGVLPSWRRRGIAKLLKSAGVHFAYSHGYRHLRTFNDDANQAILTLNRSMGYAERSAWLHFDKTI